MATSAVDSQWSQSQRGGGSLFEGGFIGQSSKRDINECPRVTDQRYDIARYPPLSCDVPKTCENGGPDGDTTNQLRVPDVDEDVHAKIGDEDDRCRRRKIIQDTFETRPRRVNSSSFAR